MICTNRCTKPARSDAHTRTKRIALVIGDLHKACTKLHTPPGHNTTYYGGALSALQSAALLSRAAS